MGGHHTKIAVRDVSTVTADVLLDSSQSCISYMHGGNKIEVSGDGNVVSNVEQIVTMDIDQGCVAKVTQGSGFQSKIANAITQSSKATTQDFTGWLDAGSTTVASEVDNTVKVDITEKVSQKCVDSLHSQNLLLVAGNNNVLSGIIQETKLNKVGNCLMQSQQMSTASSGISTTINQHAEYKVENPFGFIGDAIEAIGIAVAVFIFLIALVFVYEYFYSDRAKKKAAPVSSPTTTANA
jgi:hypothetical protein